MTDFETDCLYWRKRILTGNLAHWCYDWDCLPVDETTIEIECCNCFSAEERATVQSIIDATVLEARLSDPTDLG